ncbi:hypothetical protein EHEL_031095 [Encephalitozoon hellem ATCC 50504]|uniref:uncharacterized protein n=1 Tax=Encephalitozoon hellem (strain ATCC 50504) TaxID=907965 RepID=UPI00042F12A3|nr:uncharacterized protein EHEL_031095 [Encephalitozoon hellem ATCC 50504]AHL28915.1 hypothetical protein EHEL_031095 [Encephalitozoon hellem ATCC 50504]
MNKTCKNNECVDKSCKCPPCSSGDMDKCKCSNPDREGNSRCSKDGSHGCVCRYK